MSDQYIFARHRIYDLRCHSARAGLAYMTADFGAVAPEWSIGAAATAAPSSSGVAPSRTNEQRRRRSKQPI